MTVDLVIFDMDGTVIDSEGLAEDSLILATEELSRPVPAETLASFHGRTLAFMFQALEEIEGSGLPAAFFKRLENEYVEACQRSLKATAGTFEAIAEITPIPVALASNGERETIEFCLKLVGLDVIFENRWFSAQDVAHPKPAPDLFLHAASVLDAKPADCVVIEDSIVGIEAAIGAGMTPIAFCGNQLENRDVLATTGAPAIEQMSELPAMIAALNA